MKRLTCAAAVSLALLVGLTTQSARSNDYPTIEVADYVFACMASNGQTRQALEQCSCSIDIIASIMPFEAYVEAETVMRMRLLGGEKGSIFRTDHAMKAAVSTLKRAQAEAEIRCF